MTRDPDVVVLRKGAHGMSTEEYADALRERLPDDVDVMRARTPREEREGLQHATIATGHEIDEDLLAEAEELKLFACAAAGYEHLPLDELDERGVAVTNASGVHGPNIAEHVIGTMLMHARDFQQFLEYQDNHEWHKSQATEIYDSTVTVVGLGAIGQAIVERLEPFGVETIGVRYTPEKGGPTDEVVGFDDADFHDALARSDYVVLACPLTQTTEGLISDAELETMEPHTYLVNIGRGPIVDTAALTSALQSNAIGGAALDVTDPEPLPNDHPLWDLSNAFVTPHTSGHTPEYYTRLGDILTRNYEQIQETGEYENLENQVL